MLDKTLRPGRLSHSVLVCPCPLTWLFLSEGALLLTDMAKCLLFPRSLLFCHTIKTVFFSEAETMKCENTLGIGTCWRLSRSLGWLRTWYSGFWPMFLWKMPFLWKWHDHYHQLALECRGSRGGLGSHLDGKWSIICLLPSVILWDLCGTKISTKIWRGSFWFLWDSVLSCDVLL